MRQIMVLGVLGMLGSCAQAQAADLVINGAAVAGSPPLSVVRPGGSLFGAGAQSSLPNVVAEDFVVGGPGWRVESLQFFGYQTGAFAFPFTSVSWSVLSGDLAAAAVVASGTTAAGDGGLVGHRVSSSSLASTSRGIYRLNVDVPDFTLAPGPYWLSWTFSGSASFSGPFQPPTADGAVGNAQQSGDQAVFGPVIDTGDGLGVELPFVIQGSLVPEPGGWALMLAGGLVIVGAARRRPAG